MTREEADNALAAAIRAHAEAYDIGGDGFLSDFMYLAVWTPEEADGHTGYTLGLMRQGRTPQHVARGMSDMVSELVEME